MSILGQKWFPNITRPSRYLGGEVNSIRKDPSRTEVSVALVFPDVYEVGMSHLGLKIIYHILNSRDWIAAERAFSPWVDLEVELRRHKIPPTTLESDHPLRKFDLVGFSLQYELSYTNILNMLDLSGIPFLAGDRSSGDPLIIAGGPVCFNPEPVADFFDIMVIGDGEEAFLEICDRIRKAKREKRVTRDRLLRELRHVRGVYIPSLFRVHYGPKGAVEGIEPSLSDYTEIKKAVLPDLDTYPYPESQIVPFTEVVHDRLSIEISRGCTRGCRFCQAGMIYRPVRERSPESIIEIAENALRLTGYEEASLLSLSSGDYSCIGPLLKALMDRQARKNVGVSLPSLRIDSLDPSIIEQIKRVRKTGFTLAPEAGNDRLRRIINKGLTQDEILKTARAIYGAGWNLIKLYFMIGLPYEEQGDLEDIIELSRRITSIGGKRGKRPNLNVSISTFVPKPHTPFMWMRQISLPESRRRIKVIQDQLRGTRIRVKWNQPEQSWLEGVFARGDRRLSRAIIEAWKLGAGFDAWGEHFKVEVWKEAFARTGVDTEFYLQRERPLDEVFPWDHIDSGVTRAFLLRERIRAEKEQLTPDCRRKCLNCGVCDQKTVAPVLYDPLEFSPGPKEGTRPAVKYTGKYRLTFKKLGRAKHLGHLELARVLIRAFRRAGLDLVCSKGYHPMPKVSFFTALPVGTESEEELVDIELVEPEDDAPSIRERVNRELPQGVSVTLVKGLSPGKKRGRRIKESRFLITLKGPGADEEALRRFLESGHFSIAKVGKKGEHEIDARALVSSIFLVSDKKISMTVKQTEGPGLKPEEIVKGVFSLGDEDLSNMEILKTGQVLG